MSSCSRSDWFEGRGAHGGVRHALPPPQGAPLMAQIAAARNDNNALVGIQQNILVLLGHVLDSIHWLIGSSMLPPPPLTNSPPRGPLAFSATSSVPSTAPWPVGYWGRGTQSIREPPKKTPARVATN